MKVLEEGETPTLSLFSFFAHMLRRHNNKQRKNRLKRHALAGASRAVGYPPTVSYGQKPEPTLKEDIK